MNTQRVVEGHTQLPWTLIDEGGPEDEYRYGLRGADRKYILSFIVHDCTPTQENMQFIVHACNNIERLEKVNEALGLGFAIADRLIGLYTRRAAWIRLWPNHCPKCEGAGGWSSFGNYHNPPDAGPCSCVEDEQKCPRCGKDWPDATDGPENETCPHCGWNAINPDCCPMVEIDPYEAEKMDEARAALAKEPA